MRPGYDLGQPFGKLVTIRHRADGAQSGRLKVERNGRAVLFGCLGLRSLGKGDPKHAFPEDGFDFVRIDTIHHTKIALE